MAEYGSAPGDKPASQTPMVFVGRFDASSLSDWENDVLIFASVDDQGILPVWVPHEELENRPSTGELLAAILTELTEEEAWQAEFSTYTRGKLTVTLSLGQRSFDARPSVLEPLCERGILQEISLSSRVATAVIPTPPTTIGALRDWQQSVNSQHEDSLPELQWDTSLSDFFDTDYSLSPATESAVISDREEELFKQMMSELGDLDFDGLDQNGPNDDDGYR